MLITLRDYSKCSILSNPKSSIFSRFPYRETTLTRLFQRESELRFVEIREAVIIHFKMLKNIYMHTQNKIKRKYIAWKVMQKYIFQLSFFNKLADLLLFSLSRLTNRYPIYLLAESKKVQRPLPSPDFVTLKTQFRSLRRSVQDRLFETGLDQWIN